MRSKEVSGAAGRSGLDLGARAGGFDRAVRPPHPTRPGPGSTAIKPSPSIATATARDPGQPRRGGAGGNRSAGCRGPRNPASRRGPCASGAAGRGRRGGPRRTGRAAAPVGLAGIEGVGADQGLDRREALPGLDGPTQARGQGEAPPGDGRASPVGGSPALRGQRGERPPRAGLGPVVAGGLCAAPEGAAAEDREEDGDRPAQGAGAQAVDSPPQAPVEHHVEGPSRAVARSAPATPTAA